MNLRSLMCVLGAVGVLGFSAACEIKEGTSSSGTSDGGAGGDGGSGDGGAGVGGTGGGGGMGGAGGGAAACYDKTCGEYITFEPEEDWCDAMDPDPTPGMTNPSYEIYEKLALCTCGDPNNPAVGGKCKEACKDEACAGMNNMAGGACITCIQDTAMGCGNEANACANDL